MSKVKEITVNVSKKIGLKNFSSAMLSASITMTVEDDTKAAYTEAWGIAWEELNEQEKKFKEEQEIADSVDSPEPQPTSALQPPTGGIEDNVVCQIHKVKMNHYSNADGEWWSHKVGDKWCNGRDTKYNKEL